MVTCDFIFGVVENYLLYNADRVMCNWAVNGGWERWFQGELNWAFSSQVNIVETEILPDTIIANNTLQRVDISLKEGNYDITYIELKCLSFTNVLNNDTNAFFRSVKDDWKKLWYMRYTKYSLVMIPNDANKVGENFMNTLLTCAINNNIPYSIRLCRGFTTPGYYMYVCLFEISNDNANILNL